MAYGQAMAEFQAANFAKAATETRSAWLLASKRPQVEPIFTRSAPPILMPATIPSDHRLQKLSGEISQHPCWRRRLRNRAQSNLLSKNFKAAAQMAAPENDPQLAEQALHLRPTHSASGKNDEAIRALEKLTGKGIHAADEMRGAISLAQLYAQKGTAAKPSAALNPSTRTSA
jgi:hypothetical protein